MSYTSSIKYEKSPNFNGNILVVKPKQKIEHLKESILLKRSEDIFHHKFYETPCPPEPLGFREYSVPENNVYILRLLIKTPGVSCKIPEELSWAIPFIQDCLSLEKVFPNYQNRFWYLTIRHGDSVSCGKEASTFHVDGFQGIKLPRHIPQQSIIWTNKYPTHWAIQPFFVRALDKAKHNIHDFFEQNYNKDFVYSGLENMLYLFDPYCVHRRDPNAEGFRTLMRMTVSPVIVEDDTNTINPAFLMDKFNNDDPRNYLLKPGEDVLNSSIKASYLRKV